MAGEHRRRELKLGGDIVSFHFAPQGGAVDSECRSGFSEAGGRVDYELSTIIDCPAYRVKQLVLLVANRVVWK